MEPDNLFSAYSGKLLCGTINKNGKNPSDQAAVQRSPSPPDERDRRRWANDHTTDFCVNGSRNITDLE